MFCAVRISGVYFVTLSLLAGGCLCFYGPGDSVVELTPQNFDTLAMSGDEMWIIEFYAPWCGHCQALTADWKKSALALKGIVKVGAVNADEHKSLASRYGISGFPSIKFFGDGRKPVDYEGQRTADGIVNYVMSQARSAAMSRLSGRKSGGESSRGGGGESSRGGGGKKGRPEDVVELTDSNFDKEVLQERGPVLVEFYAPWCGHCKSLAPEWAAAATELKGKVKLCALDATVETGMVSRYEVRGYPTIKFFPAGDKSGDAEEYDGGRTSSSIVSWALDKFASDLPPPEVFEMISHGVMEDNCQTTQLCIVSVLPHIFDCQSECRNNFIHILMVMADKYKKHKWGWLWVEAGTQQEFEAALEIGGYGYPALVALNSRKQKFSPLKGPFSESGINEFLRNLSYGKGSTVPLRKAELPKIVALDAWDGKDVELPPQEDLDLSDVELDDLDVKKDEL